MGSFKNIGKTVAEKYQGMGAITVYLESSDDRYLIGTKWFSNLKDRINFVSVSGDEKRGDGGCKLVIERVKETRGQGITAYGIVDRDVLLGDPNFQELLWWEVDDNVFVTANPYGETIFVLHRWELENYLLHPNALEQLHKDKFRNVPPSLSPREIAELLIQNEKDLIAVTLFSSLHETNPIPGKKQADLRHSQTLTGVNLRENVKNETNCTWNQFEDHEAKILQFAENKLDALERWDRLSRLLDGKRVCHRIEKLLFYEKFTIEAEMGILASTIANQGLVDKNLTTWLNKIAGR
jgi:hypothetical protein